MSAGCSVEQASGVSALLPAAVTGIILGSQASSLLALCIMAEDVGLSSSGFPAVMALTRLRCLKVWELPHGLAGADTQPCQSPRQSLGV